MYRTAERWLPIPGFPDSYQVSDRGAVISSARMVQAPSGMRFKPERRLKGWISPDGYVRVLLSEDKRTRRVFVHDLVMETFVGPRPAGAHVCHADGDPQNNYLPNLRYDTPAGNAADRKAHGTEYKLLNDSCPHGHPYAGENLVLRKTSSGVKRACLICHRTATREGLRRAKGYYERRGIVPPSFEEALAAL